MSIHETIESFKKQLDQWDSDMSGWEHSARETGAQVSDAWKKQLEDMRERSADMRRRFNEVEHAAEAAASDFKESMELAWNAIKMGVYAIRSEFETGARQETVEQGQSTPTAPGAAGPAAPASTVAPVAAPAASSQPTAPIEA
jgi:hypothetical protein